MTVIFGQVTPPSDMRTAAMKSFQMLYPNDVVRAVEKYTALLDETGGADPTSEQLCAAVERERASLAT